MLEEIGHGAGAQWMEILPSEDSHRSHDAANTAFTKGWGKKKTRRNEKGSEGEPEPGRSRGLYCCATLCELVPCMHFAFLHAFA